MPDELSVPARPGAPGSPLAAESRPEAWARWIVGWHLAFWLLMALMVLRVAIAGDLSTRQRLAGLAVTAVLSLGYLLTVHRSWSSEAFHRAHQRGDTPPENRGDRYTYLGLAVVGSGAACAVDSSLSMLLFITYPQTWMLSDSRRTGVAFTSALTASATAGFLVSHGWSLGVLRVLGPQMLVSLLFSILLGMWIWRVIEQSGERAELIAQLEATRSELAAAHHAQGVMTERERVAREIHDTLAQGFTSIVMLSQAASAGLATRPERAVAQLAAIEDVARENLAEARALVSAYTPVDLDGSTLTEAVRRLVERFARQTGLQVDLRIGDGVAGLSRAQEVVVLRATQEALTNVRRHARAHRVLVRLEADERGTRVEVGDDGVGFVAPADAAPAGFGLAGIRGRVSEVGGELDIASSPGGGTRVTVLLPGPRDPGAANGKEEAG